MLNAHCFSYTLNFTFPAGTSRGVMTTRDTYFIVLEHNGQKGIGECAPLPGLSEDDTLNLELVQATVDQFADAPLPSDEHEIYRRVRERVPKTLPSVRFGLETALLDLLYGGQRHLFPRVMQPEFAPLPINGLVWMGDPDFMLRQIEEKIALGFRCIKLKVGAIDFERELRLLAYIRQHYDQEAITLRVDANGAFAPDEALDNLHQLAAYDIHSIEQPIRAGQPEAMAALCHESPVPIALDEELIGWHSLRDKEQLLDTIQPQYIILKPTLIGGLAAANEWIRLAEARGMGWWATSALESNIGLNAIAQWVATQKPSLPQGLGTGQLYYNNIASPIVIRQGYLLYDQKIDWNLTLFQSLRKS